MFYIQQVLTAVFISNLKYMFYRYKLNPRAQILLQPMGGGGINSIEHNGIL